MLGFSSARRCILRMHRMVKRHSVSRSIVMGLGGIAPLDLV